MKVACFSVPLSLLVLGGCVNPGVDLATSSVALATGSVAVDEMPAYCSQKALVEFGFEPKDIRLLPTDSSGGIYTIHGRYPQRGEDFQTFQCQFDPSGIFISVIRTEWTGTGVEPAAEA